MKSLILIPAYNEGSTIGNVVRKCCQFCDVLVVDDGSCDDTRIVAENNGAVVTSNEVNKGYEYSLNVGYAHAKVNNYDVLLTLDADGQLPPDRIPDFLSAISSGSRLVVGERRSMPRYCERTLALVSSAMSSLSDPYCGMKAYDLNMLKSSVFSAYNSIGTSLALEYIERGLNCKNIAIEVVGREGQSRFGGRLASEIKLVPSMFVGIYRLLKNRVL